MSGTGSKPSQPRGSGFTLLELLIVLALLTLAAVAIPLAVSGSSPGRALDLAARDVVLDLRRARTAAQRTQVPVSVTLESTGGGIRIDALGREETFSSGITLFSDASPSGSDAGVAGAPLEFFPDGSATGAHWRLALKGRAYRINVGALTGEIRVEAG